MFRLHRSQPWPPTLDLTTVRETLSYVHEDVSRVPGLEKVAAALQVTLDEIAHAERSHSGPVIGTVMAARFFPRMAARAKLPRPPADGRR